MKKLFRDSSLIIAKDDMPTILSYQKRLARLFVAVESEVVQGATEMVLVKAYAGQRESFYFETAPKGG